MKKIILFIVILFLIGVIAAGWFVNAAWLSSPQAGAPIEVWVDRGLSYRQVRDLLASKGLIVPLAYDAYARVDSTARQPKAGAYEFRAGTSYRDIARSLFIGQTRDEVAVRVIEGKTIDDEADVLKGLGADVSAFVSLVGQSRGLAPFDRSLAADYPFLSAIPEGQSLEGYLFPDTYRVWKDQVAQALVQKQLGEFNEKVIEPFADQQKKSGMTWHEIVTLASIVEAEVRTPEDRKIVAGIFLNRLDAPMRLQSDATLNYIIGEGRDRATAEDLKLNSPYNSYTYDGLPPGPIGNPSLSSLTAVLDPAVTDYHYFLTDKEGKVYYAKNFDEHQRNRQRAYGE